MMLGQLVMMGQRAKASAERIFEVLDEPVEITERPDAHDLEAPKGASRSATSSSSTGRDRRSSRT